MVAAAASALFALGYSANSHCYFYLSTARVNNGNVEWNGMEQNQSVAVIYSVMYCSCMAGYGLLTRCSVSNCCFCSQALLSVDSSFRTTKYSTVPVLYCRAGLRLLPFVYKCGLHTLLCLTVVHIISRLTSREMRDRKTHEGGEKHRGINRIDDRFRFVTHPHRPTPAMGISSRGVFFLLPSSFTVQARTPGAQYCISKGSHLRWGGSRTAIVFPGAVSSENCDVDPTNFGD
jgi:hypothetical protein